MTGRLAAAAALLLTIALAPAPAHADEGPEQIVNGTFDAGTAPWWGTGNLTLERRRRPPVRRHPRWHRQPVGRHHRPERPAAGRGRDVRLLVRRLGRLGQGRQGPHPASRSIRTRSIWRPSRAERVGQRLLLHLHRPRLAARRPGRVPTGRQRRAVAVLRGRRVAEGRRRAGGLRARHRPARTRQHGRLPPLGPQERDGGHRRRRAVLEWQLKNANGTTVAKGKTEPAGQDASSGQHVQTIDFGSYRKPGTGYTLVADGETSRPFDIAADLYDELRVDALKFYYTQRSGIEILDRLRPGYARPAGHLGVRAQPGRHERPVPARRLRLPAGRPRRLVRRRRSRQVRGQRRHLGLPADGAVRASTGPPSATARCASRRAATACPTCWTRPAGSRSSC